MRKTVTLLLVFAAGVGVAMAARLLAPDASLTEESAVHFDSSAPVEDRLRALEQALDVERQARQLLQEEVLVLTAALDETAAQAVAAEIAPPLERAPGVQDGRPADRQTRAERRAERTAARLIDAGFTPSEVEWIFRRESELRMEALNSRYEARRAGEDTDPFSQRGAAQTALRTELGDERYERYLEANGRGTRVSIQTVFEGSPALQAGLRPGDQILRYDGRRVFDMDEIVGLTFEGQAGEPVPLDIVRNGVTMQVSIPRGPLGVTGGRRFRR